nr:tetratricopeptide repeat protein [Microseira wollei]
MCRGSARAKLEDKQGAIEEFNQAMRIDPKNANIYNNRGLVRHALQDYQAAIEDYNLALRINRSEKPMQS